MSLRIPCEEDLKSTVDATFAKAAVQCQHAGGFCIQDGYCHFGGDCFIKQDLTREQMLQEMQFMKDELRDARAKAQSIESKQSRLIQRLKSNKAAAFKNGNSERAFALSWVITQLDRKD